MAGHEKRPSAPQIPLGQTLLDNVFLLLFLGIAVPILFYTIWGLIDVGSTPPAPPPAALQGAQPGAAMPGMPPVQAMIPQDAQRVEVVATEFAFMPATLSLQAAGRPVAVTLVNRGTINHDWALRTPDGKDVAGSMADTEPGGRTTVVFTLPPGAYEAWCTVPGHYEAGMKGRVTVR